jgi:hypothetical protein
LCLATERERDATPLSSSMEEMQAFYDDVTPRAEAAIAHCCTLDLAGMPEDVPHGQSRPPFEGSDTVSLMKAGF